MTITETLSLCIKPTYSGKGHVSIAHFTVRKLVSFDK